MLYYYTILQIDPNNYYKCTKDMQNNNDNNNYKKNSKDA